MLLISFLVHLRHALLVLHWLLEQKGRAVREALRRVALTDDVQGLLGVLQDDLATALEAGDAHGYYFSHAATVLPEVADACLVLDYSRDT